MTETIKVSESLELHAVAENHVTPLYQLICKNKTWLQQSLNWPQFVQSEEDTRKNGAGQCNVASTRICQNVHDFQRR